jgi:hypothetical protein
MTPAAAAAAANARPATRPGARPRTFTPPPRPRRVSGPAKAPARTSDPAHAGLAVGVVRAAHSVSRHRALDRLIRGRAWIALIAFALIGIVTLQLLVLSLNASMGRALERQARLQRENAALSIEGSELASGERVEAQAAHLGMEIVPISALRFLGADPRTDFARAAAALNAPVHQLTTTSDAASPTTSSGASTTGGVQEQGQEVGASAPSSTEATADPSSESAAAGATGAGAATTASAPPSAQAPANAVAPPAAPTSSTGVSAAGSETTPSSAGGVGAPGGTGADQAPGTG